MKREIKLRMFAGKPINKMLYDYDNVYKCFIQQVAYNENIETAIQYNHNADGSVFMLYTGLKDKNDKEGYFDSDIWQLKDYEYRVVATRDRKGNEVMRTTKKIDLKFILKQGLLRVEYDIINKPPDLDVISLNVIFNLKNKEGKRIFVDKYRHNLEIIGNIYENPELLK